MKHVLFVFIALFALSCLTIRAQQTSDVVTESIQVNGACGMCKNHIEKNLKMEEISSANWNKDTKILIVSYDPSKMINDAIQKKVASLGHDTEKYRAKDSVYQKLPGCCHYDREAEVQVSVGRIITESIQVSGVCGMCKNRIQKTLKMDGVSEANWDKETKVLLVTYNPDIMTNDSIQKKITSAGHDTEKYKADDQVYEKLPGCCHYDHTK